MDVKHVIKDNRIICPKCKKVVARIEEGTMVQGSAKCSVCGYAFGFSNVRNILCKRN